MWELFWIAFAFAIGSYSGQTRATNIDITEKTSYMQNLIDVAYAERDESKRLLELEKLKVDIWQKRYFNILEELENEESGSGSGDDGSFEGPQRSNQLQ